MKDRPVSENELDGADLYDRLDFYLSNYGSDRSITCVSELDGFFTSLACGQTTLLPEEWLPAIWGTSEDQPNWESIEQKDEYLHLVFILYVETMDTIVSGQCQPVFMEYDSGDSAEVLVEEWCVGFMRGALLTGANYQSDKAFIDEVFAPMRLFGTEKGWKKLEAMNKEEIEFWKGNIQPCVIRLAQSCHPEIQFSNEHDENPVIH